MVDFARVQNRIYYGYEKAAIRLGVNHTIYRASTPINPIQSANIVDTRLISIDQNLKYMSPRKYGDMTWQFLPFDGLSLETYDYMVGPSVTYFISDVAPDDRLSPPLCIECNNVISISRPNNLPLMPGTNTYQQYQPGDGILQAQALPCALLEHSRTDSSNMKLPTSVKLPYYELTLPDMDSLEVMTGDIITDDNNRRLIVISAEQTKKSLGLRITAMQLGT